MSGLVFFGDTVYPAGCRIDLQAVRSLLQGKHLVLNLEGPIISGDADRHRTHNPHKANLYSVPETVGLLKQLGVVACSLANNHINDFVGSVGPTVARLSEHGIAAFGTDREPTLMIELNGRKFVLMGCCGELPERKSYPHDLNPQPFMPAKLLRDIEAHRADHPQACIVVIPHWGYELMLFPEPADREWAHRAIDAGADYVIGHHPHVVQGVEQYRHGWIAYSLGNFIFPHMSLGGRSIGFPQPEVLLELGAEIGADGGLELHWLRYDPIQGLLAPVEDGFDGQATLRRLTPFAGFDHVAYRKWFVKRMAEGNLKRRRGGPVYYGYFGRHSLHAASADLYMRQRRKLRRWLLMAGLHRPSNA